MLYNMEIVVILHNIRSVYNVGSIFRTGDAARVSKIYLCGITPSPIDRFGKIRNDFSKVALGAQDYISFEQVKSANRIISKLKNKGWKIFSVEQSKNSVSVFDKKIKDELKDKNLKIALILGDEVRGIPESILKKSDKILEIPMRGKFLKNPDHPKNIKKGKESLNVSVSFAIVVFSLLYS